MASIERSSLFGISAEFDSAEDLLAATKKAKAEGYRQIKAYSPFEVEGLSEVLEHKTNWLPWMVLGALLIGAVVGFTIQYVTDLVYGLNMGGRPYIAWQTYSVITFDFAILFAGLATITGFLLKAKLPLPYNPIFNAEGIDKASSSHFFLCILSSDEKFNVNSTTEFLKTLGAANVSEVSS